MSVLKFIGDVFQTILDIGPTVILPFLVLILGLVFRMKFADALKSGILIGAGFVGIFLMVDLMVQGYAPVRNYYEAVGGNYTVTNIGWSGVAAIAWSTPFAIYIVPLGFLLTFILFRLKFTRTLNIDVWNYYSHILSAAVAFYVLTNLGVVKWLATIIAIVVGLICGVVACKLGDRVSTRWQGYFDMPEGVTCSTFDTLVTHYPMNSIGAWIYDHIPGLKNIELKTKSLETSKIGSWGSIPVLSFVISIILLAITRNDIKTILTSAITVTASIVIMPKCVGLLMEGLVPISNSARTWAATRLKTEGLLMGMDVSIGLGDPTGMTTTLILLPLSVALAYIVPGINFIPVGLFGGMIWSGHAAAFASKGNLLKSVFAGGFYLTYSLLVLSFMAPVCTQLALNAGVVSDLGTMVTGSGMQELPVAFLGLIGKILGAF